MFRIIAFIVAMTLPVLLAGKSHADDIADIAGAVSAAGHDVPAPDVLRSACDKDALCVARFLKDRIGDPAAVVPDDPARHKPQGWKRPPPIHRAVNDLKGTLYIVPARFDAQAISRTVREAAGGGADITNIVIDLREIDDHGNLDGMRRAAALFTGGQDRAFRHSHIAGRAVDWVLPKPAKRLGPYALSIWLDHDAGAVVEAFAALMRLYAGARIMGTAPTARGYLMEYIPVIHGWMLRVPTGRLSIPGIRLEDGLQMDGPVPE